MTRVCMLLVSTLVLMAQAPRVEVISAYYGFENNFADVTERVRARIVAGGVQVPVGAETLGVDPLPGTVKVLRIYYRLNGEFALGEWRDGDTARVGTPVAVRGRPNQGRGRTQTPAAVVPVLTLVEARYGADVRLADVLSRLQGLVQNNQLSVLVSNQNMGGDPAVAKAKQLTVVYDWQGQRYSVTVKEGQPLTIPGAGMVTGAATSQVTGSQMDSVCLFSDVNYQGSSRCLNAGEELAQLPGGSVFRSVRFQGRTRTLDLFEAVRFNGKSQRVEGDQPDVNATYGGGGFFGGGNANKWVTAPGSLRVGPIQ